MTISKKRQRKKCVGHEYWKKNYPQFKTCFECDEPY